MKKIYLIIFLIIISNTKLVYASDIENINPDFIDIKQSLSIANKEIDFEKIYENIKKGNVEKAFYILYDEIKIQINSNIINYKNIMLTIFWVCLLSLFINIFSYDLEARTNDTIINYFVSGLLIDIFITMYNTALETVKVIISFVNSSLPVYLAVTSVLSQQIPLSVYTVFIIFVAIFEWLVTYLMFPMISFKFICTILGSIYPDFNVISIKKFISGFIRTVLGFYTTFFVLGLKLTQTITYTNQKLVLTGIQFTVSKGVPVIGGFLSETAEALFSSIILLHNAVGVSCVFVILVIITVPFAVTFIVSLSMKLICTFVSAFSDNNTVNLVNSVGECICDIAIILLCAGVTFIIALSTEFITVR